MTHDDVVLLGIDGGGTSTVAWVADAEGNRLGRGAAGPTNAKAIGPEAARAALVAVVERAFHNARLHPRQADVACLGLAGFDRPEDKALLSEWSAAAGWARRLILVNDADLVLAAGTPEGFGLAVIAGTGSIAIGKTADGRGARAGGWGYLLGDEGSAYSIALAGLRLAARRHDGREAQGARRIRATWRPGQRDALTEKLCEAIGVASPAEFISTLYSGFFDRVRIAALAPAVVAAAESDADVTNRILIPAGEELGLAAHAVAKALGWTSERIPLALAGGFLLSSIAVSNAMLGYLARETDLHFDISGVPEPVQGAIVLAERSLRG